MIYATLSLLFTVIALCGYIYRSGLRSGKDEIENKVMKGVLDDVHIAKGARDALAANLGLRRRLRSKRKPEQ